MKLKNFKLYLDFIWNLGTRIVDSKIFSLLTHKPAYNIHFTNKYIAAVWCLSKNIMQVIWP